MLFLQWCLNQITLSDIYTVSDAFAEDKFWKHCDRRRNCSKQAISPFATMFSILFSNCTFIYRYFPRFWLIVFKFFYCRCVVCGKGLRVSHNLEFNPIQPLMHLEQTTFENINEKFLLLSQYFQLDSIIIFSFIESFHNFAKLFSMSSAADLLYVRKG